MAGLWAVLPAADAVRLDGMLDALARRSRQAGDPRTLDQLRADELLDRVLGRTAHLVVGDGTVLPSHRDGAHEHHDAFGLAAGSEAASEGAEAAPVAAAVPADVAAARPRDGGETTARTVVHLTVSLATLLGADDAPGDLAGYGPIDAQQARAMALDLGSTWQRIVTDPLSGTVLDVGRTTYRPPAALADHVRHRDKYCTAPGCPVPATRCDLDHTLAYDPPTDGTPPRPRGTTCAHNLGPLCRAHHRLKTAGILRVHQPTAGEFIWRTPTGHAFRVRPGTEEPTLHLTGPARPPVSRPPF